MGRGIIIAGKAIKFEEASNKWGLRAFHLLCKKQNGDFKKGDAKE